MATAIRRTALVLALAGVIMAALAQSQGWLDYQPGGAAFDAQVWPAFGAALAVCLLIALRWEVVGGILAIFAGTALIAVAQNQLVTSHAIAVVASLAVPAMLWIVLDLHDLSRRRALVGLGFAAVAAVGGYVVGEAFYESQFGPTHPESSVPELPTSALEWIWSGSVTSTEAEVRAKPATEFAAAQLAVSTTSDLADAPRIDARDVSGGVIGFDLSALSPDTTYHYAVELDGVLDEVRRGRLRTFPEGVASFSVAVGSCARVGSNGAVFDAIRELDPLFYLITGDLHYGDNGRNDLERYQAVMDLTLSMPAQAALYRSTAVAYMWDDHDYGANNADGSSPSRRAAMAAYREYVPSYDLSGDESAVYQAFTAGRVRFILTDARSARDLDNDEGNPSATMLGGEQKAWFKNELETAALTHELIVWVNPVPWVADAKPGADNWGGYADERNELADFIASNDIDNLLMVSGDAHMLAVDDGTNTDYSTDGYPGFPLLHAAALDRPGSVKGGPYSEGTVTGPGQFAMLDIQDDGASITVGIDGRNWQGDHLMSFTFTTD